MLISGWNLGEGDPRLAALDFYLRKPFGPMEIKKLLIGRLLCVPGANRSFPLWP